MFNLSKISEEIHNYHKKNGDYDIPTTLPDKSMMVVNEISAAINSFSKEKRANPVDLNIVLRMYDMKMSLFERYYVEKIEGSVEDELTDALIKLLDIIGYLGIDIDNHLQAKLLYLQKNYEKNENKTIGKKN